MTSPQLHNNGEYTRRAYTFSNNKNCLHVPVRHPIVLSVSPMNACVSLSGFYMYSCMWLNDIYDFEMCWLVCTYTRRGGLYIRCTI